MRMRCLLTLLARWPHGMTVNDLSISTHYGRSISVVLPLRKKLSELIRIRRKRYAAGLADLPVGAELWKEEAGQFTLADEFLSEIESARTGKPVFIGIQNKKTTPEE